MKTLYLMFGLPACGKSTWIDANLTCKIVSADQLKTTYSDYNVSSPELVHQRSVKDAAELFKTKLEEEEDFCFDSGSINNNYTYGLVQLAKSKQWTVKLVHIDTPVAVCLQRNAERDRVVPPEDIIDKSIKLRRCLERLRIIVDEIIEVPYYTHKHIFFDMDGTLAAYQYLPKDSYGCINFVDGNYFEHAAVVQEVINKAKQFDSEYYILSAIPDNLCYEEKQRWLDTHCSFIPKPNRFFIGNKEYKHVMLRNLLKRRKISMQDVLLVDDNHRTIDECNAVGIHAVHPSMFLCMEPTNG